MLSGVLPFMIQVGGHRADSRGKERWARVDPERYEELACRRWSSSHGYAVAWDAEMKRHDRMHRLVLRLERSDPREVDHINGDPLDNRRSNLRPCTRAENGQNMPSRNLTSKYRGVTFYKPTGRWAAWGKVNGKSKGLGYFKDEQESARVSSEWREKNLPFTVEERSVAA